MAYLLGRGLVVPADNSRKFGRERTLVPQSCPLMPTCMFTCIYTVHTHNTNKEIFNVSALALNSRLNFLGQLPSWD